MKTLKQHLILLAISSVFVFNPTVFAQTSDAENTEGLETCFQYYDYGKVEVNLATHQPAYKSGETAQITGTVINQNSFPLVDVIIYAQLRRVNTGNVTNEGHYLLERKQLTAPMDLLAGETRFIKAEFPLLDTYPAGSYQLQTFVVSLNGFNYAGRPFLEEDFAGTTLFDITDSGAPLVYFNPLTLRVNQNPYSIRGTIEEFTEDVLNFSVQIVDGRAVKTDIPVTVKFYTFDDTFEKNLVSEQKTVSKNGRVDVQFQPVSAGAYVMVIRMDSPAVSELKFRFAGLNGPLPKLQVADLGITSYPPGTNDRAYVCIYAPSLKNTVSTSVQLEVLDKTKRVVAQNSITKEFTPEVVAISVPVGSIQDNKDFSVKAIIKPQNDPGEIVFENRYDCGGFESSPQDLTAYFSGDTLSIEATNSCGRKIGQGGYIESLRIKNKSGEIVKEFYNLDQIKQDIDLKDLPKGQYSAEVKSGNLSKNYPFIVSGVLAVNYLWAGLAALIVLLLAGGVFYYRKRKAKLEAKIPEKI